MKTAVSIPDELFRRAEVFARHHGKSRSQVYREAISEYLMRRDAQNVTRTMNEVLEEVDSHPDPWLAAAGRRALERSEW